MRELTPVIYAYLAQEESVGHISCATHTVDGVCRLHGHDFYELELICAGRGRQWLNGDCVPLERGSLYLCTPEDVHRVEPDEPDKIRTSDREFDRRYIVESESQSAALMLLTPQLFGVWRELEKSFRDEMGGLIWDGDTLTLALNTQYVFADVPASLDARDADTLRSWYAASLKSMQAALDLLLERTALFGAE